MKIDKKIKWKKRINKQVNYFFEFKCLWHFYKLNEVALLIALISNFFSEINVQSSAAELDIDLNKNDKWLNELQELAVDKRFNLLHININSILGFVKHFYIVSILNAGFTDILCI